MKTKSILFCLLFAITANSFTAAKAQVNVKDSLALVDLYNNTNGPSWFNHKHWLYDPVSTWYGITVTGKRVTQIYLEANRLEGFIPYSIGYLTALTGLYLPNNSLSGTIPTSIGNLSNLSVLFLDGNHLTGLIPESIGNLITLTYINFRDNTLTGSIPSSIGNLINLNILSLDFNHLSGILPSSLGNLVNLSILDADDNYFIGSLPSSLGNLTNATEIELYNNRLSGEIPASFKNLKGIGLNNNQLTQNTNLDFPDIKSKTSFLNIEYNRFTFNGLEFIAEKISRSFYSHQAQLSIHKSNGGLSVSAGGTLKNNTYRWFIVGQKEPVIIRKDSTFHPTQSGRYYAKITNKIAVNLTLKTDTISYTMPAAQTQNSITNVAAVKAFNSKFSIYPNPAKDVIHVQINGTADIVLTNSAGKILLSKSINNSGEINVSSYANGVYYIQNKTTGETQKLIVSH